MYATKKTLDGFVTSLHASLAAKGSAQNDGPFFVTFVFFVVNGFSSRLRAFA